MSAYEGSFQEFADTEGVTENFRMNSRGICWLTETYDTWRSVAPPSEWGCGRVVCCRRTGDSVTMDLSGGAVVTVRIHKKR
jgi:hypothetical protein